VHFLSLDQQSGIHCLMICMIQLLTPNNLGGTWKNEWMNGLLQIAAQCWIVHETLKQEHTVQNHSATVSKNIQLFSWLCKVFQTIRKERFVDVSVRRTFKTLAHQRCYVIALYKSTFTYLLLQRCCVTRNRC